MVIAALLALPLVTTVALDPQLLHSPGKALDSETEYTLPQKEAMMRALVRSATACVAHAVSVNPRFAQTAKPGDLNELIVDSITPCAGPIRNMIEAHDRLFGRGSGEAFFMGPYLDVLPATVARIVGTSAPASSAPSP